MRKKTDTVVFICLCIGMQVRIGTQRGSGVVKLAVIAIYILLFTFGLVKALPLTCIVSHSQMLKMMVWMS